MSNNEKDFELCMRVENVVLPAQGYFGISAATGGLADDHDVNKFSVWSLRAPGTAQTPESLQQDSDAKKIEQEFEEYQKKLKEQKDQWAKEHPDQVKPEDDEWDNWFSESEKELQQIYQGQSAMRNILNELETKMVEILQKQDQTQQSIAMLRVSLK